MLENNSVIPKKEYMNYVRNMDDNYNMTIRNVGFDGWRMALTVNIYNSCVSKVPYRAKWETGLNDEEMLNKIIDMLKKDIPVIMTVGPSSTKNVGVDFYKQVRHNDKEYDEKQREYHQYRRKYVNMVDNHFVAITGVIIDENAINPIAQTGKDQRIMLRISSWGSESYISYSEYREYICDYANSVTSSILCLK